MTQKPKVVLIHGFSNNPAMWKKTINFLDNYECHTFNLNELGIKMKNTGLNITTMNYAKVIQEKLLHHKIINFHLVGHSMGGYVSAALASLYPEKIKSLSLVHSILGNEIETQLPLKWRTIKLIEKGTMERNAFLKAMINNLFTKNFLHNNRDLAQHYFQIAQEIDGDLLVDQYKAIIERPNLTHLTNSLSFPIHWMVGAFDKVVAPEYSLNEVQMLPKSFLTYLKNSSHMGMDEEFKNCITGLKKYFQLIEQYYS